MNSRATCVIEINRIVIEKKSLSSTTRRVRKSVSDSKDCSLILEIIYGVLRNFYTLNYTLDSITPKKISKKNSTLRFLLVSAIYQLHYTRIPKYAVIAESIKATKILNIIWSKNLITAVINKSYQEKKITFPQDLTENFNHPDWLKLIIQKDWPGNWREILKNNNSRPPMTLRVNTKIISRNDYILLLEKEKITSTPTNFSKTGVSLKTARQVQDLPLFREGGFIVQDEASQLTYEVISPNTGQKILDLCAAPGGKTTHLLQGNDNLKVVAIDNDEMRLSKLKQNLKRLKLACSILHGDATEQNFWANGKPFDVILVDAPCSSSGVIRRHPDIKLRLTESRIEELNNRQLKILMRAWKSLKINGICVYSTCSIFACENDEIVRNFLMQNKDAFCEKIDVNWGIETQFGRQILTGHYNMDGFYFSKIRKTYLKNRP